MCFQILAWHPRTYVKEFMDMLPAMLNKDTVIEVLHCVQFFYQHHHYPASSGFSRLDATLRREEKPLRATLCLSIEHAHPRDTYTKTSNDNTSSRLSQNPFPVSSGKVVSEKCLVQRAVKWLSNLLHEPFFRANIMQNLI